MDKQKLPHQLQKKGFGFVKLLPKSKQPFEPDWPNKPHSLEEILPWLNQGNNYGVLGGLGELVIVDADTPEMVENVKNTLPSTFTVKTPKKGTHFYFICPGISKKIKLKKNGLDHGEIISTGSQVVGPGSIHPDTGTVYTVDQNEPIYQINQEELLNIFADYTTKGCNDLPDPRKALQEHNNSAFNKLVDQHGDPYYFGQHGTVYINQGFWAGVSKEENIQIYDPDERSFYRYDGKTGISVDITDDQIKTEISTRMLEVSREIKLHQLERKRTDGSLKAIVSQLKGISEKRQAFQKKENYVHLANGVVVFKDNDDADLLEFLPGFFSRNYCPIEFDENARCDRFLHELLLPAVSDEDAMIIQKYVGLCLLGNNLIQRFLILEGQPGKGKSTLSLIIQKLIGQTNVTQLRTQHLDSKFEIYRYLKKTLLVGVDVPGKFLSDKGAYVIKGLVGGDMMDAEQKHGTGSFQIQGSFCTLITANSRLQVKLDGDIGAWRRRLLICQFEGPPPEKKIPDFAEVLIKEEGSGILNWALYGLYSLLEDIRYHGDIYMPDSQEKVVDALLAESDSLRHFLKNKIERSDNNDLSTTEIVEAYAAYCPSMGWNPKPITIVHRELEGLMLELFQTAKSNSIKREGKSGRGFHKVKFKNMGETK